MAHRVWGPQDRPSQTLEASGVGEQPPEERGGEPDTGQPDTERRACRVLGHPLSTQRYEPSPVDDEKALP